MLSESEMIQKLMQARTRIAGAAWFLTRDYHAAEDCFQNVVLKAMTKEVCFPTEAALLSWAFVVIRRDAMDWLERRGRKVLLLDENVLAILDEHRAARTADPFRSAALQDCIGSLGEEAKHLLQLRYFEGLRCQQIATKMRISLPAVYKRLSRIHQGLADCVRGKMITPEGST
ncbi:MAG: RNA polymerase sigma factor [Pirellula sp.]|jgi:RNA polymerase sigma factor (sigma-70 family)|nr:sigma-70 family RNA polymerase sigma factor [Planctomycetota bacterium]